MDPLLLLLLLGSGLQAEGAIKPPEPVRLVGGSSRCAGDLELKYRGIWRQVHYPVEHRTLKAAQVACTDLDCGSAVSLRHRRESSERLV
ncbi:putative DMBT1-like protein [Trematomus bernacchii]|uniref:putative DMBT1-like protein n=1 Tax=Trematomus bernacchii TaxID=40690 RepID=UPI00146B27B3|nr:putative DMBT1-like protein [Trematomus bernacchii]